MRLLDTYKAAQFKRDALVRKWLAANWTITAIARKLGISRQAAQSIVKRVRKDNK